MSRWLYQRQFLSGILYKTDIKTGSTSHEIAFSLWKILTKQENTVMYKTTTATYTDKIALKNVDDELVNKGVPRENFFIDEKILQIKVMMPESEEQEIMDILNRHGPTEVH